MYKLMPILKPYNFHHEDKLLFKIPLLEKSNSPIIIFGSGEDNLIKYEYANIEENYEKYLKKIYSQALENLKEINVNIEILNKDNEKIVFVSSNKYASEKIIDKDFMQIISKKINSNTILVGIPFKEILIAIDSTSKLRAKFAALIKEYYQKPQNEPITCNIFLLQDGEIIAMAGKNLNNESSNIIISEDTNSNNYKITIICNSLDELNEMVSNSFQQVMYLILDKKVFGGSLSFDIKGNFKLSDELIDKCNNYTKSIKNNEIVKTILKSLTNLPITISFFYNGNKVNSDIL